MGQCQKLLRNLGIAEKRPEPTSSMVDLCPHASGENSAPQTSRTRRFNAVNTSEETHILPRRGCGCTGQEHCECRFGRLYLVFVQLQIRAAKAVGHQRVTRPWLVWPGRWVRLDDRNECPYSWHSSSAASTAVAVISYLFIIISVINDKSINDEYTIYTMIHIDLGIESNKQVCAKITNQGFKINVHYGCVASEYITVHYCNTAAKRRSKSADMEKSVC